jgi:hypothetical protein
VLSIMNQQGRVIEEITHDALGTSLPNPEKILESLYEGARRRAMGVEEAFDSILASLGSSSPPPRQRRGRRVRLIGPEADLRRV